MTLESDKELTASFSTCPSDHEKHGKHGRQESHFFLLPNFLDFSCGEAHETLYAGKSLHSAPNFSSDLSVRSP